MSQTTALDLKAISERYFAAWAAHDPDAIVALHTADTQFWMHMGGEPVVGRDAVRATFAEIFEQFPDLTWETYRVLLRRGPLDSRLGVDLRRRPIRLPRRRQRVTRRARRPQGHVRRRGAAAGRAEWANA